jgi:hypothetical protein
MSRSKRTGPSNLSADSNPELPLSFAMHSPHDLAAAAPKTTHTCALTLDQIQKLRNILVARGWEILDRPYMHFLAQHDKLSVSAYEKGPKVVVQGRGVDAFIEFILEPEITGVASGLASDDVRGRMPFHLILASMKKWQGGLVRTLGDRRGLCGLSHSDEDWQAAGDSRQQEHWFRCEDPQTSERDFRETPGVVQSCSSNGTRESIMNSMVNLEPEQVASMGPRAGD